MADPKRIVLTRISYDHLKDLIGLGDDVNIIQAYPSEPSAYGQEGLTLVLESDSFAKIKVGDSIPRARVMPKGEYLKVGATVITESTVREEKKK